jgi:hypothetical protein
LVTECFEKLLKEVIGSYNGHFGMDNKHSIERVADALSKFDDAMISDTYTNNNRIVIEFKPNSTHINQVIDMMKEYGYRYYSMNSTTSKTLVVFKRK